MDYLCRLCITRDSTMESVFRLKNGILILDMIQMICPIQITRDDKISKKICSGCLEIIAQAYHIRALSVQTDNEMREMLENNIIIEPPTEDSLPLKNEDLAFEQTTVHYDPVSPVLQCEAHRLINHSKKVVPVSNDGDDWSIDKSSYPECEPITTASNDTTDKRRKFVYFICGQRYTSQFNYERHLKLKHYKIKNQYQRPSCDDRLAIHKSVKRHQQAAMHNNIQESSRLSDHYKMQCDLCSYSSCFKHSLEMHMKNKHFEPQQMPNLQCDICEKKSSSLSNLRRHKLAMHDPIRKPFCCDRCTLRFDTEKKMCLHRFTHHIEAPQKKFIVQKRYACNACKRQWSTKFSFDLHMLKIHRRKATN